MIDRNFTDEVSIDISQEEYDTDLAQGLNDDEVLKPGRHTFRRGGFLARHGIDAEQGTATKRRILLNLDSDVFIYFEERTDDAEALHAQINYILRKVMELEQGIAQR